MSEPAGVTVTETIAHDFRCEHGTVFQLSVTGIIHGRVRGGNNGTFYPYSVSIWEIYKAHLKTARPQDLVRLERMIDEARREKTS